MNKDNIVNILLKEQRLTDLLSNREVYHDYIIVLSQHKKELKFVFQEKESAKFFADRFIEFINDGILTDVESLNEREENFLYEVEILINDNEYNEENLGMLKRILLEKGN